MQEPEKGVLYLLIIGAALGIGKLLVGPERLTMRLILGRAILGSGASMVAGVALLQFPAMPLPVLVGIGSGLGILGAQFMELWLKHRMEYLNHDQ